MGELLSTAGLVKAYKGRRVVDQVALTVGQGEIVGLLGPNGAGKTTTFRMCMGMVVPDEGTIRFRGNEVTTMPIYRRARLGLGYLAQEPSVFRKLSVLDNLLAVLETRRMSKAERQERADALLEEFGLTRLKASRGEVLSGGERRRLEIARALATEPSLILLDEPFSGVDPIAVEEIQEILASLKDRGIAILLTDHNVRETLHITDRAYILAQGKVLAELGGA
jgi:lipopolysaccharide export system ATP-binding protein